MATVVETALRNQLLGRRRKLQAFAQRDGAVYLKELLDEVDEALRRMDAGTYGICDVCNESVEESRLLSDPLCRVCLDHLTPGEMRVLERDLEMAGRIQASLLPQPRLALPGWEGHAYYKPLGPVSGDFYDLVGAGGRDATLLFGDVAGKGVAASILMASLHAIFRSLIAAALPPAELLERANRLFCESTTAASFATLVLGRLGGAGSVELVNAGHCPPLLLSRGRVEPLPATGLPIGLFSNARYELRRVDLAPGDLLLLYTDGLSEARDARGEEYGMERLGSLLSRSAGQTAEAVSRVLLRDVETFRGGVPPTDDATMVVLRRLES